MTDNEIIQALECCATEGKCKECPAYETYTYCLSCVLSEALDLINRQRAEIERLQKAYIKEQECFSIQSLENERLKVECDRLRNSGIRANSVEDWITFCNKLRAEAIKEFAERLEQSLERQYNAYGRLYVLRHIENLVKEMVGEG